MQERLTQLRSILLSLTLGLGSLLLVMIMGDAPSVVQAAPSARGTAYDNALGTSVAPSATGITSITAAYDNVTGTSGDYSVTRYVDSGLNQASDPYNAPEPNLYHILHQVQGGNLRILSFNIGSTNYEPAETPDRIILRRVNNPLVSGADVSLVWYERGTGSPNSATGGNRTIKPTAITGIMDNLPFGDTINRGIDNLFANFNNAGPPAVHTSANNIERADVIFTSGLTPIAENLTTHGFLILDRGPALVANRDRFKIAAITALDGSNNPASYGALHSVANTDWGESGLPLDVTVFRREPAMTELRPIRNVTGELVLGVFVTFQDLGITAGETFFGYSLFANDVTGTGGQILLNPSTFPLATNDFSGGLDWLAGTTNVFSPQGTPTAVTLSQTAAQAGLSNWQWVLWGAFLLCAGSLAAVQRRLRAV